MGENLQEPKDFATLNHLAEFPPGLDEAVYPGRWYLRSPEAATTSADNGVVRQFWFSSELLSRTTVERPTGIQLVTYSHGKVSDGQTKANPKGSTWFEIRICGSKEEAAERKSRKLDNGQLLEWFSHRHRVQSEEEEWCLGRTFIQDDNILKHVETGDVVAVYICASGSYSNHAEEGYLCFEYGGHKGCGIKLKLPKPDNPPKILVYGEKRRECLMTPIAGSSAKDAVFVDGGVDLMKRLLKSDGKNWKVERNYLRSKHNAPNPHTIFDLEDIKNNDGAPKDTDLYETVKQYNLHDHDNPRPRGDEEDDAPEVPAEDDVPPITAASDADPKIIIWNDFGVSRGDHENAQSDARLLIYQMRSPIFQKGLWKKAIKATRHRVKLGADTQGFQRVLIVIDAEDLRAHGFNISRRVSWEKTIEDFQAHFNEFNNHIYEGMHVIVRLGYEGAIYVPPTPNGTYKDPQFHCYLVPDKAEGDLLRSHKGNIPGIDMAFVSGLAASLVRESDRSLESLSKTQVEAAVDLALTWSHRYARVRFCKDDDSINYPCPKHFDLDSLPKPRLITVEAQGVVQASGDWSLFTLISDVKGDVSSDIVTKGSTEWLESSVPTARFGNLLTADRIEIECFRSTAAVIDEYLASPPGKPLSIAVFGSPGAGKSFGVKEVIKTMLPGSKDPIEVNLSQFMSHFELLSTFHNIRDMALAGQMPVVMFDEFDSVFERQELGWLKYFLAPMQDGYFLEDGQQRSLKKAIFIFVGGTSSTWAEFTKGMYKKKKDDGGHHGSNSGTDDSDTSDDEEDESNEIDEKRVLENAKRDQDKKAKKPDFVSRLSAYINIRGLNKIGKGNEDEMFTVRRAMVLRSALSRRLNVSKGKDIPIDGRVLNALLKQRKFRHGARSITLILQMSALSGRKRFEASALPDDEQLSMHIDVTKFKKNIREDIHDELMHGRRRGRTFKQIDIELRKILMDRVQ
ncbi:pathway-specific regulatory protein nit-4 [Fusarium flagelliforme]|uniref:Pathway-specific regulatory protein nit-4 n=1 Tax=Fusarium flagelliforme TaxID=2675880 RepID=A0A395MAM0_9HYPO|nr:pathway-specific regulatory protein nit-4 [Fusarium flagelliforme]